MTELIQESVVQQTKVHESTYSNGTNGHVPSLESGDRLTRAEFERRYQADPNIKRAELIEGVVYVASPVRVRRHGVPHSRIIGWLVVYQSATPSVNIADNSTLRLDLDNEPQPDVAVWLDNGNAFISDDDYLEGAPELIVEIASSSAAIDLHAKLNAYRRNGVQEYLVLLPEEQTCTWYCWQNDDAIEIVPDADGVMKSSVFPGLWFAPERFWQGDVAGLLNYLQAGLDSAEHTAFIQK
ncbi:MAG: Uma2 family endonuclease [Caldilineaceae bacterium]|nr:Uma2 family endonuclease [Caldilineaceae bacterium]